jgi:AraC-like DNA-binding protein
MIDVLARLRASITRHADTGLCPTALPGVSVFSAAAPTGSVFDVVEPSVAVIAQGEKVTAVNGYSFTYGAGQYLIASIGLPVVGHITLASSSEPFQAVAFDLRPDRIASLLLETSPTIPPAPAVGIAVNDASPELLDAIARLLALLDAPEDLDALAPGTDREILWRLLTGAQGSTVCQIGLADSRLAHLSRAIQFIRRHYARTLRVGELADIAAMSVSSFHQHFRSLTSMTPIQFQKQIRLHEARARLLTDPRNVTGVGFAVGYDSPSQFSREYRRMFGVPPSRDTLTQANVRNTPTDNAVTHEDAHHSNPRG